MEKGWVAGALKNVVGIGNVKVDELMKYHTSFKVGGPADVFVTPGSTDELKKVLEICNSSNTPIFVIGNGTNLIVRDKGIRGVVVKIFNNFAGYSVNGEIIEANAGLLLSKLANIALENDLSGLEFASGIPGTLGGAVTMNAGAYGGEMKDVVIRTEYMDQKGSIKILEGQELQFGYRTSIIQREGGIALRTVLHLKKGEKQAIKDLMNDLNKRRKDKQPLEMPSAGSVFKRPEGYFAGKLIEDSGLRGFRIGGAEVSQKHCGFIVNVDNASANDIINLIEHIKNIVKIKFDVELQTEVKIVGEE